jgi:hypothetical protein
MIQNPAIIDPRVNAMIREFAAHRGFVGMPEHSNIYRSYEFPDTRQVWRVARDQMQAPRSRGRVYARDPARTDPQSE